MRTSFHPIARRQEPTNTLPLFTANTDYVPYALCTIITTFFCMCMTIIILG